MDKWTFLEINANAYLTDVSFCMINLGLFEWLERQPYQGMYFD